MSRVLDHEVVVSKRVMLWKAVKTSRVNVHGQLCGVSEKHVTKCCLLRSKGDGPTAKCFVAAVQGMAKGNMI